MMNAVTPTDLVAQWADELHRVRRLSIETVRVSENCIRALLRELAAAGSVEVDELDLAAVTRPQIVQALHARWGASGTSSRRFSTLRAVQFFEWLTVSRVIDSNPAAGLKGPRAENPLPRSFSLDEVGRMLTATADRRWPLRDRLLILVLATTGVRSSELSLMSTRELTRDRGELTGIWVVGAKTRKRRWVPFVPGVPELLETYLVEREERLARNGLVTDLLWVSYATDQLSRGRERGALTDWGIRALIHDLGERAGVCTKRRTAHAFRHAFATMALESGSHDLRALQEALGHATMETLHVYTRVSSDRLSAAAAAHPLARF